MDQKFAVLSKGPNYFEPEEGYNTVQQARDDGALVLAYGYVDTLHLQLTEIFNLKKRIEILEHRLCSFFGA